jgi:hypothetical protein
MGHFQTHASQQSKPYSITSSTRASTDAGKLGRSCRAVLAGASASVKSDAKCPRCSALHFWI